MRAPRIAVRGSRSGLLVKSMGCGASKTPLAPPPAAAPPLQAATAKNQPDAVRALLKLGAAPEAVDAEGNRPLHVAAFMGRSDVVATLLALRADVTVSVRVILITPLLLSVKVWNKFESSAYNLKSNKSEDSGISLIYTRKSVGPRIEPWGTPQVIARLEELTPFIPTN